MAELFDMKEIEERVILIAVSTDDEDDTRASLDELEELVKTAGGVTVDKIIQNRERIHPGTYLGKGKIDEVRERIWELQATGVVCDDELSPAQLRNLEDALDTKVMDRTMVILDIFASRATTSEGKIQVELAQLKYRAARLVGLRSSLSRLGGGIGTRGPGEKKLEMDRRLIHERIGQLKSELEEVKRHRDVIRKQREKTHTPVAAIVGYTNAGKSTLLNRLTDAGILAEDKLFATLDPTTRNLELESGQQIMLTDTVGFIRKLPHHLIEAFPVHLHAFHHFAVGLSGLGLLHGDDAVRANLLHGLGDQGADLLVAGGNGANPGDVVTAVDGLGVLLDGFHSGLGGLGHALVHHHGVGASHQVLQALMDDGLGQQGGGGGAVAGHIVGLGGNFAHQSSAHVFKGILQLNLLGDGHAVIGDEGGTVFALEHHIAALGAEGDLDSIGQLVNAGFQSLAGFVIAFENLCHNNLPPTGSLIRTVVIPQ